MADSVFDNAVREMQAGEERAVASVMRRSFNWFARLFFDFGDKAFVCEVDGEIVGGITLSVFSVGRGRRGGLIKWVFTGPEARGRGVATELIDHALAWFETEGCSDVFACIEGHNTGSSNRFARRGFVALSFFQQLRRYRWNLPKVWLKTVHLFDVGHFLWLRSGEPVDGQVRAARVAGAAGSTLSFFGTILVQTLAFYGATLRWSGAGPAHAGPVLLQTFLAVAAIFSIRVVSMAFAARAMGREVVYRPWESGLFLSVVLGIFGTGPFPVPGTLYPATVNGADGRHLWSYRDELPWMGPMAYAGGISMVITGWLLQVASGGAVELSPMLGGAVDMGLVFVRILLIFEVLLPVFPFACYNGRRVLEWRRASWGVMALGTVLLWGVQLV
jgi:GNAT superfamily N-acetyltransferase